MIKALIGISDFEACDMMNQLCMMAVYFANSRFAPIIGQFKISDIATMSFLLNQVWGRVVKVGGLMGRPDLLFVFDADEIEKVSELT